MNKSQSSQFIDVVNGAIVSDPMSPIRVALVAPNGRVQHQAWTHETPSEWAKTQKSKILAEKCGDGKPLSDHPSIVKSVYGEGSWDVRIWD